MGVDAPIVVLGGVNGMTGRRVADRLEAAGHHVRRASRGTRWPFDWNDALTWRPVLEGASAAWIAYAPDLAAPGGPEAVAAFAREAARAGLRRLVLLSGRGEPAARAAERAVATAGTEWAVVRSSWFVQNLTEGWLAHDVLAGSLAIPVRDAAEPFVDVDDVAEVGVAALVRPELSGRVVEVTGPRLLSFDEVVGEIARVTGRPIEVGRMSAGEWTAAARAAGVPPDMADLLLHLFTETLDGRNAYVTTGVADTLGRPARDVREVIAAAFGPAGRTVAA